MPSFFDFVGRLPGVLLRAVLLLAGLIFAASLLFAGVVLGGVVVASSLLRGRRPVLRGSFRMQRPTAWPPRRRGTTPGPARRPAPMEVIDVEAREVPPGPN